VSLGFAGIAVAAVGAVAMPAVALIALMTATGFTQGVFNPVRDLMVRSVTPDGAMGKVMGFVSSGMNLAGGLTPLVFGWIIDIGSPRLVFYIAAVFIAIALVTFVGVKGRTVPRAAPASASA
jgi:MFS family permease